MIENKLNTLLDAPCMCCGYKGENYWQDRAHDEACPFFYIAGIDARVTFVVHVTGESIQKWYWELLHDH